MDVAGLILHHLLKPFVLPLLQKLHSVELGFSRHRFEIYPLDVSLPVLKFLKFLLVLLFETTQRFVILAFGLS